MYNQRQNERSQQYHKDFYEQVSIRVLKGEREKIQQAAAEKGVSMARFLILAVNEFAGREVLTLPVGRSVKTQAPEE